MYARGKLDEALANIETAINIVESLRTKIAGAELRASFLATYQHLYQFYIDLLMRLNQSKPAQGFDGRALQASERARARGLLDLLNEAQADLRQGVEPALFERQQALQKQLNVKAEEKRRAKSAQQAEALDKEIRKLTADYQTLQAEMRLKSPRYAALTHPQPAGLKEIQQMLDADTLLLEYSLGEERSFLWVVSQNELKTFVLPKRELIENQARAFYESVKTPEDEQKAKKAAADLSKIVIEPAIKELGNKRLLIVADGALHYIPFAALQVSISKTEDRFLIENHEIIHIPSASALAALRDETKERKTSPKTLAVIADPVFDTTDTRFNLGSGDKNTNVKNSSLKAAQRDIGFDNALPLKRLGAVRAEAMTILALVPDADKKGALDFEANRATATSEEMSQYRNIHFATHGFLNSQHPELSGIVLSLVDEKGKPQDGFLRLHEVYNLRLPADLIVLSACQTALGKEIKGEGLIGLTRGFMYAGARRVVASLWLVSDQATSKLMKFFYQEMLGEKRLRPATALREAQIAILKEKRFASPYFWAAFTIQGDWR
jgi:CHAT domain-containing protein